MVIVFLIPALVLFLVALQMGKSPYANTRRTARILKIVAIVVGVAATLFVVITSVLILLYF